MTPIIASFLSAALIFGGIACLAAPALLVSVFSFVLGSIIALAAGVLAILALLVAAVLALSHVNTTSLGSLPTVLCGIALVAVMASPKARQAIMHVPHNAARSCNN